MNYKIQYACIEKEKIYAEVKDWCGGQSLLKVGSWVAGASGGSSRPSKPSNQVEPPLLGTLLDCIEVDYRLYQALAGREWSGGAGRQCGGRSRKQHVIQ